MTSFSTAGKTGSGPSRGRRRRDWLALAASPTFAFMAWVTSGDMATMYLLMSLFHLPVWLRPGTDSRGTYSKPTTKGDQP